MTIVGVEAVGAGSTLAAAALPLHPWVAVEIDLAANLAAVQALWQFLFTILHGKKKKKTSVIKNVRYSFKYIKEFRYILKDRDDQLISFIQKHIYTYCSRDVLSMYTERKNYLQQRFGDLTSKTRI